jgi:hypothetical protein
MKPRPFKLFLGLLLCFMLPTTASAQSTYTHTAGITDIVTQGGNPKTLVVQIANLTPYNMKLKLTGLSPTLHDETDRARKTNKSFMFAPLGLPENIPPLAGDPTNAKPYTTVLSWDDNDGYTVDNYLTYTLEGVDCTDTQACKICTDPQHCTVIEKENVDVGLWITRSNPDKALTASYYFQLARNILHEVFSIVAVAVFPEVPLSWVNFVLGTAELTKTAIQFDGEQKAADEGHKWYVAAFPVPSTKSLCYTYPKCYPSQAIADDAIEENWGPGDGGITQSRIVVVTQLRRGKAAQKSVDTACNIYASWGSLGSAPVLMVTVMTIDVWNPAVVAAMAKCALTPTPDYCPTPTAGAQGSGGPGFSRLPPSSALSDAGPMIRSILEEHGREGLLALVSVVRGLNTQQQQLLRETFQAWRAGESLTPNEQALLHLIAVHLRNEVR